MQTSAAIAKVVKGLSSQSNRHLRLIKTHPPLSHPF